MSVQSAVLFASLGRKAHTEVFTFQGQACLGLVGKQLCGVSSPLTLGINHSLSPVAAPEPVHINS